MDKEKKILIIKAAVKRFSKHGLGKTTLDEIARDLRIGKATIYHYFESKHELYYECIAWECTQFLEEVKSIFNDESIEAHQKIINYFRAKEEVDQKYKLLFEVVLLLMQDPSREREAVIFNKFLADEEEVLRLFIGSIFSEKIENMNASLPSFIAGKSWGFLFAGKLKAISGKNGVTGSKELLYTELQALLK